MWIVADDVDLLPRHRALGAHPGGRCSRIECLTLGDLRRRRARQRLQRRPARIDQAASSAGSTRSRSASTSLVGGILLGIFIYWGWDSGVAVNEESENPAEGPGRAAVLSTILLVLIYLLVATAAQADAGTQLPGQQPERRAEPASAPACSAPACCRSSCSSPCSPRRRHRPRRRSCRPPARRSRWRAGARCRRPSRASTRASRRRASRRWRWAACRSSGPSGCCSRPRRANVLGDSITGLGFAILFYYGFTGLACAIYFRRELFKSCAPRAARRPRAVRWASRAWPTSSSRTASPYSTPGYNYSPPILGIQVPIVIGIGGLLLGLVFMVAQWIFMPEFFKRRPQTADPAILEDAPLARRHVIALTFNRPRDRGRDVQPGDRGSRRRARPVATPSPWPGCSWRRWAPRRSPTSTS